MNLVEPSVIEEDEKFVAKIKDKQIRADPVMVQEIQEIKDELKELCGIKISDRAITALIVRNGYFRNIKKEIIDHVKAGGT